MNQPFRVAPKLAPHLYKSYAITAPRSTHTRPATCAEVDCQPWQHGWATTVQPGSQDEAVIKASGRRWVSVERVEGGFLRYTFPPGQPCFAASTHRTFLEREPLYRVLAGDWRNARAPVLRAHTRAADWVDDFATHQQTIADAVARG